MVEPLERRPLESLVSPTTLVDQAYAVILDAIYQFRSAIEPLAVRLATARMTPADLARGHVLIEQGIKAVKAQGGAAVRADMAFHSWIYELSGNVMIVETMRLNWQHLRRAMGEVL